MAGLFISVFPFFTFHLTLNVGSPSPTFHPAKYQFKRISTFSNKTPEYALLGFIPLQLNAEKVKERNSNSILKPKKWRKNFNFHFKVEIVEGK